MLSDALKGQFDDLVKKNKVVLFMKGNKHFPQCGFSAQVIGILKELGSPFETVNVLSDANIRDGIKEYSSWPTIPQLYVNGEFVGGCDIVKELYASGELQKVVGVVEKTVAPPKITVEPGAAKAIRAADESDGSMLRLEISGEFQYELYFDQKKDGDFEVESNGVKVLFDKASAGRANGLSVEWVETADGGAFKIENPAEPPRVKSLSVKEFDAWRKQGKKHELVDVRTEEEVSKAQIEGARLLDEATEKHLASLPKDAIIVLHCHHGMRSRNAAERLLRDGYRNLYNLEGGIDAWSQQIDSNVARY